MYVRLTFNSKSSTDQKRAITLKTDLKKDVIATGPTKNIAKMNVIA